MPDSAADYQPRYVALGDIPIGNFQGDFGESKKRLALKEAEGQLEDDVNDGAALDTASNACWAAVRNLATWVLYNPALDLRESMHLAEVEEYGDAQLDYVNQYLERYESLVESIVGAPGSEDGGNDGGTAHGEKAVATTHASQQYQHERRENRRREREWERAHRRQ